MPHPVAYLVVFVASCCTLILELVAGRILAPFIGVSLYTWTSIIGVVLAGISLGNYLGGRIADRWPQRRTLGILLAAGGLASLAILPLINIATAIPTADLIDSNNRLGGALPFDRASLLILRIVVITTLIFFPPSFILGMVSPVVIKLTLQDLAHSGGLVGKVYALSTLGSIVGTFATGFVLVQLFGTRMIVLGRRAGAAAHGAVFGDLLRVGRAAVPLAAGVLLVGLLVPARNVKAYGCFDGNQSAIECVQRSTRDGWDQATNSGCLHETAYYCIRVADNPAASDHQTVKELVLDHLVHSYNSLEDPNFLEYGYIKVYAEIADYLAQRVPNQAIRVLYVGGGGLHPAAAYRSDLSQRAPGDHGDRPWRDADGLRPARRGPRHDEHRHVQRRRSVDARPADPDERRAVRPDHRRRVQRPVDPVPPDDDRIRPEAETAAEARWLLPGAGDRQAARREVHPGVYRHGAAGVAGGAGARRTAAPWQSSAPSTYVVAAGNQAVDPAGWRRYAARARTAARSPRSCRAS